MRHLASIQRITDIRPIEGRDRIVQCHVNGWNVIIAKDDYSEGDLAVYVEIDSMLPEKPEYEFLRPKKFRIRTMKMAGVLSEGICFPLSVLPVREKPYELGEDVTELMGVTKYEPVEEEDWWKNMKTAPAKKTFWAKLPLMRFGWYRRFVKRHTPSCDFPDFVPKSDETRIQNMPWLCDDRKSRWVVTEKVDGCSATYALVRRRRILLPDKFEFIICSRNKRLDPKDTTHYQAVAKKYKIEDFLRDSIKGMDWVAVQGEIIGPKIQGNKYKRSDYLLYLFNYYVPDGDTYRRIDTLDCVWRVQKYGLTWVPVLASDVPIPDTVDGVLAMAHGKSAIGDTIREGIVCRSPDGKQSFKAVDPEFLIHYKI